MATNPDFSDTVPDMRNPHGVKLDCIILERRCIAAVRLLSRGLRRAEVTRQVRAHRPVGEPLRASAGSQRSVQIKVFGA